MTRYPIRMAILLICTLSMVALAGCSAINDSTAAADESTNAESAEAADYTDNPNITKVDEYTTDRGKDVTVLYDSERDTYCYLMRDGMNAASVGGISCVPANETTPPSQ